MQAHRNRTTNQTVNHTQSLSAVQMLLKTSLCSIAYLRNLLPDDNFSLNYFSPTGDETNQSFELLSSQESSSGRDRNGVPVYSILRDYSSEADRLLNYLEFGIYDALQKCYLRSFIFAIYLDNKDPNNIVEAYTFNFRYHTVPGSKTPVPIMTFGRKSGPDDAVSRAIKSGKAPTLKDVRASVKTITKALISAMNSMDPLPRRRYATFKLYYTEETPMDYEPPHFQTGDVDRDKWYFTTHDFEETPDRYDIGTLDTGHHAVKLTVTSIASFIPARIDQEKSVPSMTSHQGFSMSMREAEKQLEDAEKRSLVFLADQDVDSDPDAYGEEDPDYVGQTNNMEVPEGPLPIGLRGPDGEISPLTEGVTMEAQFNGVSEKVVTKLQDMAPADVTAAAANIEETQPLFRTPRRTTTNLPASSLPDEKIADSLSSPSTPTWPKGLNPQMLSNMSIGGEGNKDYEMLDLETQLPPDPSADSIESFERTQLPEPEPERICRSSSTVAGVQDKGLDCECGIDADDECCFCEGGCGRWFHVWCMGFHSAKDSRMPKKFVCFDCRAKASVDWEFIKMEVYPRMLEKFCELTSLRRAIKVAERSRSFVATEFYRAYGCTAILGGELIRKLEEKEFIYKDSPGSPIVEQGKGKSKSKGKARPKRNIQKLRYTFNFSLQSKAQYMDYFKPNDIAVENRLLGVSQLMKRPTKQIVVEETQTQAETQPVITSRRGSKRGSFDANLGTDERPFKKVKISVAEGVDLAE